MTPAFLGAASHSSFDAVLARFGTSEDRLIGKGTWARVYELDDDNVLRVLPDLRQHQILLRLQQFYRSLSRGGCCVCLPEFLEVGTLANVSFVIERRIGGTSLAQRLETGGVATDAQMLDRTLVAIDQLANLLPAVPQAGELLAGAPIREDNWREFLMARAQQELEKGRSALTAAGCDVAVAWDRFAVALAAVDPNARQIVHGDLHPGNIMVDAKDRIVGIIDFGPMTLAGDPTLDRVWAQLNWPGNASRLLSSKSLLAAEQAYLLYWAFRFSNVCSQSLRLLDRSVAIIASLTSWSDDAT